MKSLQDGGDYEREHRVVLPDGQTRWIGARGRVERDQHGQSIRLRGVSADITERKRVEEVGRNENELMAAVFNSVPGLLYLYREDGQIVRWNKQHEETTGFTAEELLNRRARDWYDEEDRITFDSAIRKIFSEGYAEAEMKLIHKNGEKVPYFLTGSKVIIDGKPHLVGIAIDISARKKAQTALRDAAEQHRILTTATADGYWVVDTRGRIVEANDECCRLYGYRREELLAMSVQDFEATRNPAETQAHLDEILRAGHARFETRHRCRDGRIVDLEVSTIFWQGAGRFLAFLRNISARKEAEQATRRHLTELAHATRVTALGELAGSLAHELNQPLTAILSNAQAAQRFLNAPVPELEELRDILHDIVQDDARAGEIIRRMRALVKKDALDLQSVDLGQIIRDVAGLLRGDAVIRNIQVKLELNPRFSLVHGDRIQLQQVMLNLLLNAFDAMKENGETNRRVTVRLTSPNEGTLQVAVCDRGVGLKQEQLDKLFRPFQTTKPHGLGLGLSISRSILEVHGGRLWAENNTDSGATFYFTLPVHPTSKKP